MTGFLSSGLPVEARAAAYAELLAIVEYVARKQSTSGWAASIDAPTASRNSFRVLLQRRTPKGDWAMMARVFCEEELAATGFAEWLIGFVEEELDDLVRRMT